MTLLIAVLGGLQGDPVAKDVSSPGHRHALCIESTGASPAWPWEPHPCSPGTAGHLPFTRFMRGGRLASCPLEPHVLAGPLLRGLAAPLQASVRLGPSSPCFPLPV